MKRQHQQKEKSEKLNCINTPQNSEEGKIKTDKKDYNKSKIQDPKLLAGSGYGKKHSGSGSRQLRMR
jgi:hypothetical protein